MQLAHQADAQAEELDQRNSAHGRHAGGLVPAAEKLHRQIQCGRHASKYAGHHGVVSGRDPVGREHPVAQGDQGVVQVGRLGGRGQSSHGAGKRGCTGQAIGHHDRQAQVAVGGRVVARWVRRARPWF